MAVPLTLSSVPNVLPYNQYIATAGQTVFPYTFPITQDSDLVAIVGINTLPTDSGYTLTGQGNATGGTVVFTTGLAAGTIVTFFRDVAIERVTQISQNSGFSSTAFNAEYNNIYLILQQLEEAINFCLQVPNTNSPAPTTVLTPASYANKYLTFDAYGNPQPGLLVSSGSLTAAIIGNLLNIQTAAEAAVGVVPVNYIYVAGVDARYNVIRDGVTDNSTAIQNWLNVGGQGQKLYATLGNAVHASTVIVRNNTTIEGEGRTNSVFTYTGASDGWQSNNPINSSTAANIKISDIDLVATNPTAGKANYADVGSTFVTFTNVGFHGAMINLILDQTELFRAQDCDFEVLNNAAAMGVWIVNGAQHTAGAMTMFTNQLIFDGCQFNSTTASIALVADDGGVNHEFRSCNFDGSQQFIRVASVRNFLVYGGEWEFSATTGISFNTTLVGGSPSPGQTTGAVVRGGSWAMSAAQPILTIGVGTLFSLEFNFNAILNTGTVLSGINNVTEVHSEGNLQLGGGDGYLVVNNYFDENSTFVPVWSSSGTAPHINNGTIAMQVSRKGKQIKCRSIILWGSTTSNGTGTYYLSLPYAAAGTVAFYGVGDAVQSADHMVVCKIASSGALIESFGTATNALVGATSPTPWASGMHLEYGIEYTAANQVG